MFEGKDGVCPWFLLMGTWGVPIFEFPEIGFPSTSYLDQHSLAQCPPLRQREQTPGGFLIVLTFSVHFLGQSFFKWLLSPQTKHPSSPFLKAAAIASANICIL